MLLTRIRRPVLALLSLLGVLSDAPVAAQSYDGIWVGERGYTDPERPSPGKLCLESYPLRAEIFGRTIRFESDGRVWTVDIDPEGYIYADVSMIKPPPRQQLFIRGHVSDAQMWSAYCGNGFFGLRRSR